MLVKNPTSQSKKPVIGKMNYHKTELKNMVSNTKHCGSHIAWNHHLKIIIKDW